MKREYWPRGSSHGPHLSYLCCGQIEWVPALGTLPYLPASVMPFSLPAVPDPSTRLCHSLLNTPCALRPGASATRVCPNSKTPDSWWLYLTFRLYLCIFQAFPVRESWCALSTYYMPDFGKGVY